MQGRGIVIVLMAAALSQTGGALAAQPAAEMPAVVMPAEDGAEAKIQSSLAKLDSGDFVGMEADLNAAIASDDFNTLEPRQRGAAYMLLALAEYLNEKNESALIHIKMVPELAPELTNALYWGLYRDIAMMTDHIDEAATAATNQIHLDPSAANDYSIRSYYFLLSKLDAYDNGEDLKYGLLDALYTANYTPDDLLENAEGLRFDLFEMEVAKGNEARAKEITSTFSLPDTIVSLRIDRRYRPYFDANPTVFDIARAQQDEIDTLHAAMATYPQRAAPVQRLAYAVFMTGEYEESLSILDEALSRIERAPQGKPPFSDLEESHHWLLDTRTWVLWDLGRQEEALANEIKARDVAKANGDLISQFVNLAGLYNRLGRPADALEAVSEVPSTAGSEYGNMAVAEVRVCAYAQLSDLGKVDELLTFMRDHQLAGVILMIDALTCTEKSDELAAFLIARLEDPETRLRTLRLLQAYIPEPHPTAETLRRQAIFDAVVARPDVQAVINRVGAIESFPMLSPSS